jgi:hypothetical protein
VLFNVSPGAEARQIELADGLFSGIQIGGGFGNRHRMAIGGGRFVSPAEICVEPPQRRAYRPEMEW